MKSVETITPLDALAKLEAFVYVVESAGTQRMRSTLEASEMKLLKVVTEEEPIFK